MTDQRVTGEFPTNWSLLDEDLAGLRPIVLVIGGITTVEWYALHDKQPYPGQRYRAWLEDGTYVVEASRQPFCDGARELLAMGFNPKSTLVMRRHGSDVISLKGTLGDVAKLSVHEDMQGVRFGPYRPFDPPMRPNGLGKERSKTPEATHTAGAGQNR
jgi:hypothetical protein